MLKILIISLLLFWLIVSLIWYAVPHKLLNIKYTTNLNLKNLNKPHLIIVSHYYNTVDATIMCNESKKTKNTINIIAEFEINNLGSAFNQFWKSFPIYTPYRKVNLYKGKNNNLVQKSIDYLNKNEHVLIFLKKEKKSKGIYHILKETKVPILFVKIYKKGQDLKLENRDNDTFKGIVGKDFVVDYNIVENYNLEDKKDIDFMKWVKNNIYD